MNAIRQLIKDWMPPAIVRVMRNLCSGGIRFEGDFATWDQAAALCTGYDAEPILAKVLDATLKVKRGEAAFERDSVLFDEVQYSWPVTVGLMWAAAQNGGKLHVLDFGGALGSSYFQNRSFLTGLKEVSWSVIEQPHYVEAGKEFIENEELQFYYSIDSCLEKHKPVAVLLSSVIQYLSALEKLIADINSSPASVLIIDRTPFYYGPADRICIQRVPPSIYKASYPMRVFSHDRLIRSLEGWRLVEQFPCPEGVMASDRGYNIVFSGLILARAHAQ